MTGLIDTFAELLHRAQASEDYWLDIAVSDFARDLHGRMKTLGVKFENAIPFTAIFDKNGRIAAQWTGGAELSEYEKVISHLH